MVHGDWSPKNLLISAAGLTAIDFECAHFGDPSYDAAFLTNHLLLKAFHRPRLAGRYCELARTAFNRTAAVLPREALAAFEADTARHLAFLLLARIDGKSPVEYIVDKRTRERIRLCALRLIADRPRDVGRRIAARRKRLGGQRLKRFPFYCAFSIAARVCFACSCVGLGVFAASFIQKVALAMLSPAMSSFT